MRQLLSLALPVALFSSTVVAAPVAVVPGSNASYLYLPASNTASKLTVTFHKEGSFTGYRISSEPAGVSCGHDELMCTAKLNPNTRYTFFAEGQYTEGLHIAPRWSEGCQSEQSISCSITLSTGVTIRVTVPALSAAELTPVLINGKGKARFLYQMSNGSYLVGATYNLLRSTPWQSNNSLTMATDANDGRVNMPRITDSAHVEHCQSGLPSELGSGWYWPAYNELGGINNTSWMTIVNVKELWSSTEADASNAYKRNMEKPETKSESKTKTDRNGLCVKRF
jgi:hypothetical protein